MGNFCPFSFFCIRTGLYRLSLCFSKQRLTIILSLVCVGWGVMLSRQSDVPNISDLFLTRVYKRVELCWLIERRVHAGYWGLAATQCVYRVRMMPLRQSHAYISYRPHIPPNNFCALAQRRLHYSVEMLAWKQIKHKLLSIFLVCFFVIL